MSRSSEVEGWEVELEVVDLEYSWNEAAHWPEDGQGLKLVYLEYGRLTGGDLKGEDWSEDL